MKALLKTGEWEEIDTSCLFENQYNTKETKRRIFDADILRIVDDARIGMGKCRYCGAMVRRGEEEAHFLEMEKKTCEGCFWHQDKRISSEKTVVSRDKSVSEDGKITERKTVTETTVYEKVCSYKTTGGCKTECTNTAHRANGIRWFTPDNTFFLKYPNGFSDIECVEKLEQGGFIVEPGCINAKYKSKLGSYTLKAILRYQDGKPTGIKMFNLSNCRRNIDFRIEEGKSYKYDYSFGWSKGAFRDIPDNVISKVKTICANLVA